MTCYNCKVELTSKDSDPYYCSKCVKKRADRFDTRFPRLKDLLKDKRDRNKEDEEKENKN